MLTDVAVSDDIEGEVGASKSKDNSYDFVKLREGMLNNDTIASIAIV